MGCAAEQWCTAGNADVRRTSAQKPVVLRSLLCAPFEAKPHCAKAKLRLPRLSLFSGVLHTLHSQRTAICIVQQKSEEVSANITVPCSLYCSAQALQAFTKAANMCGLLSARPHNARNTRCLAPREQGYAFHDVHP
eukprot:1146901-Pelagomonas_calceolata.AAC.3